MKKIHLIATDKQSRLIYDDANQLYYQSNKSFKNDRKNRKKFNIYITNDEDINENDYIITQDCRLVQVSYLLSKDLQGASKVILTTDQDLIKDGVQAIDDEFLEWLVKNPSCEFFETYSLGIQNAETGESGHYKYEIIIPNLEIWKDIPDFEGYYQVSNLGNVKSLSRTILGKNDTPTLLKEKMLKFSTSTNGYYQVILCKNSDRKIFKVHSLVAICFLNHTPDGTHNVVVDHINEIKTDNSIENLRLIGHRENVSRSIKDSTSTYVGVSWSKNAKKWISQITIEGKTKYLGLFDNEEDANKKYLETLKDL